MQHAYRFPFFFALATLAAAPTQAQSLLSGFMAGKGNGSVVLSGTAEKYQSVFIPDRKVSSVPLFRRAQISSLSVYVNYGISDKIDLVVTVPYIHSEGSADELVLADLRQNNAGKDFTNARGGLQDVSGYLKFKPYSREVGNNILDLLGAVGVSTPASNYQTGQGAEYIIAIGNRATKVTTMGIAQLKTPSGVFFTNQAGYSLRSGRVPNAFVAESKIGYAGRKLYADGYVAFQQSSKKGTDIVQEGFDFFFPATRVNYTRIGLNLYRPIAQGFGVVAGASAYVAGRNLGKSTAISGGASYNF
ncbi:hypothetical protein SAMN02745146_3486 [Hymenobacter daecheongensis DSM 21074]|uniref:MetA-pathway of phenol degradation n=1 Tax=Hymenobacter daecheongensis DSM 21074 TaxID=1121955 RepID=A0A1M6KM29_9BACT|nr:hypothetical protein [Hymenobacter daecheongensis]SHJ59990.1 hypothetical protein SAMN02745146_3486 [Hymenobacter daecheongensis DSM 21074]